MRLCEPHGALIPNNDESMVRAVLQGVGLLQNIEIAVRAQLESGALVRVLQLWCRLFAGFYLYVPSHKRMPARVRALKDFIVEKRLLLEAQKAR